MSYKFRRVTPLQVKKNIGDLMDIFPKVIIRVARLVEAFNDIGEQIEAARETVYEGEALVRPASGTVEGYGLGTVENLSLVILINGVHNFRQNDIVTINDGREYEVDFPPTWFESFTILNLQTRSQVTRPT